MNVCVIGGGVSGCMAAATAAQLGARVVLFEKNDQLLKKLFISGKGRCNVTNQCSTEIFLKNVVTNARFLYSAMSAFDTSDCMQFFERLGVKLKVERGNRVFPASDKSNDIVRALTEYVVNSGVQVRCQSTVKDIVYQPLQVVTKSEQYPCDAMIVCTGGCSYPATGSSGDGYHFAKQLGLKVVPQAAALVGIRCKESFCSTLAGLTLKNVALSCTHQNKIIYQDFGEVLFTHTGISGPMALSLSSYINRLEGGCEISIDLKPALSESELDTRVQRDFTTYQNKLLKNALFDLLPMHLVPIVLNLSDLNLDKAVNQVTAAERSQLVYVLKHFGLTALSVGNLEDAIVTAGGVAVGQLNPTTLECKELPGIFFAGEVIDVDALTGGFNIQIALSTGYAAGKACVRSK